MQIYTRSQKLQQALNKPELLALIAYFRRLEAPAILRDIRKDFPDQAHLDKNLDLLIDQGIVSRQERRYELSLAVLNSYPASEKATAFQKYNLENYSAEQLLVWLGEEVWIEEPGELLGIDFSLAECRRLEHSSFDLVTINRGGDLAESLPNYFKHIDQPKQFPSLAPLVGDVNPEFFTNQIALILERIIGGKAPRRESIFLESLLTSQVITSQPEWQLSIPVYEAGDVLDVKLEMDDMTRFFFVRQLAEQLLGERESFTYLIKKKA